MARRPGVLALESRQIAETKYGRFSYDLPICSRRGVLATNFWPKLRLYAREREKN